MVVHVVRRIGFFRRRWVWALLLLGIVGVSLYWLMPWRGPAASLQLGILTPQGDFRPAVTVGADQAAPPSEPGAAFAVPLVLGVSNRGHQAGRPDRLVLSVPERYRLADRGGRLLRYRDADEPLQRYVLRGPFPPIQGGRVPTIVPGVDTLWLQPVVRDYYCAIGPDSLPELVPAGRDSVVDHHVRIFYSFQGGNLDDRQTGLVTVTLPASMFPPAAARAPEPGPVQIQRPRAPQPPISALLKGGSRRAECGAPADPVEIETMLWLTPDSGRVFVLYYGGVPRKEFFDLNRDSVIELEMWDPDGDGRFEASRSIRIPVPEYLLPLPEPAPDTATADSLTAVDSLRFDSARADTSAIWGIGREGLPSPQTPAGVPGQQQPGQQGQPPAQQRQPGQQQPPAQQQPAQAQEPRQPEQPAAQPQPEPERQPPPRPRRRNVPLGSPVDDR